MLYVYLSGELGKWAGLPAQGIAICWLAISSLSKAIVGYYLSDCFVFYYLTKEVM